MIYTHVKLVCWAAMVSYVQFFFPWLDFTWESNILLYRLLALHNQAGCSPRWQKCYHASSGHLGPLEEIVVGPAWKQLSTHGNLAVWKFPEVSWSIIFVIDPPLAAKIHLLSRTSRPREHPSRPRIQPKLWRKTSTKLMELTCNVIVS
jgi:hypothetical protein